MNYREILEDFVNNENTEYCYDWQGFNYEIILPCIEKLLKNENNLQFKIDKAIEMIEFDKKDKMWDLGEGNTMILQEKRANELLDILKEVEENE